MTTHRIRMGWLALASTLTVTAAQAVPVVKLNDTGADLCRDDSGLMSTACAGTAQDGEVGRDVTANVGSDGRVGFSYSKVCNNGSLGGTTNCPATAVFGSGPKDWACVKDLRSGLVWEVKTADGGVRDGRWTYTNQGSSLATDATGYVAAVNAKGLCGSKNWRLPTRVELQGLLDYGVAAPNATIDLNWFPNTFAGPHWTGEVYIQDTGYSWSVGFHGGYMSYRSRSAQGAIRLVRGAKVL